MDMTDPINVQEEIDGPLPDLVKALDTTLDTHISIALAITSQLTDTRQPDYPLVALQQLARNALLHRTYEGTNAPIRIYWYSDRIEIQNPGGPFGQVNRHNFGTPGITDYRNVHVAEAMKNLGHIQRFGMGILLAQKALANNGNPPAEFKVEDTYVLATVRKRI
jgi:ATP-dependent DNA helicase RecG